MATEELEPSLEHPISQSKPASPTPSGPRPKPPPKPSHLKGSPTKRPVSQTGPGSSVDKSSPPGLRPRRKRQDRRGSDEKDLAEHQKIQDEKARIENARAYHENALNRVSVDAAKVQKAEAEFSERMRQKSGNSGGTQLRSSQEYSLFGTGTTPSPKRPAPTETRVQEGAKPIPIVPAVCENTAFCISDPRKDGARKPVFLYRCLTLADFFRRVARVRRLKPEQIATIEVCFPGGGTPVLIDHGDASTYRYCLRRIHLDSLWRNCGLEIPVMSIDVNVIANQPAPSSAFINAR